MKTKKLISVLLAAILITSVVGGCKNDTKVDSSSTAKLGSTGKDNEKPQEKAKLKYTYWGSAFEKDAQADAVAAFVEKNPNVEVEAMHIPSAGSEYIAKLTAMTASGTNPDVGYMDVPTAFVWAKEEKFYDIFELIDKDSTWSRDKYVDDIFYMYEENKSFGTTSSINPRAIFYNTECFQTAGVDVPPSDVAKSWTWDEFIQVAKKLTIDHNGKNASDPDFDAEQIKQYGVCMNPADGAVMSILLDSNKADLLNVDGTKIALDTPEAKEVLQALHDMIYVHHVSPIPDFSAMPDGPTWLKNKQSAMLITGQWVLLDIAKLKFEYGIGQLPKFQEPRNIKDAGTRVIFKNTKHADEAWELYKFLANPDGAMNLYKDGLWMPTLREWYEDDTKFKQWGAGNPAHPESYQPVVADSLFNGTSTPSWGLRVANFAEINNVVSPLLQQLWLDSAKVDAVVSQINDQANGLVKGYNPGNYHDSEYRN